MRLQLPDTLLQTGPSKECPLAVSLKRPRVAGVWVSGLLALFIVMLAGLRYGATPLSWTGLAAWLHGTASPEIRAVLEGVRLPRVIMAANAGATLALGGLAFQTVLRNPLAEPYILGVSGGAAVGVISGLLLGCAGIWLNGFAFAGGLCTLGLVCLLDRRGGASRLLLAGVMINAFCGAVILFLLSLARESDAGTALFWFMGDLGGRTLGEAGLVALALAPCHVLFLLAGHGMNLLLLGGDAARSLGVPVRRLTFSLLVLTSFMTSLVVAAVGPLGFVGLVVPQALRLVVGCDNRRLAPACLLFGAAFLVGCDVLSRLLPTGSELPSGVMTALVGAPAFIFLLRKLP